MLRIKTKIRENYKVYTLPFNDKYITILNQNGKTSSIISNNLLDAASTHIKSCLTIKKGLSSS